MEARFRRIHEQFIAQRASWLAAVLQTHLLGSLPEELAEAAMIPESSTFQEIQRLVATLTADMTLADEANPEPSVGAVENLTETHGSETTS